jgi:hypothetical protein
MARFGVSVDGQASYEYYEPPHDSYEDDPYDGPDYDVEDEGEEEKEEDEEEGFADFDDDDCEVRDPDAEW